MASNAGWLAPRVRGSKASIRHTLASVSQYIVGWKTRFRSGEHRSRYSGVVHIRA